MGPARPPTPGDHEDDDSTQVGPTGARALADARASSGPEVFADRYEALGVVGAGGGGVVMRARDRLTGALVAVKRGAASDAQATALFEREARVLSRLRHAAIVRYLDHGVTQAGLPFLVMELLAGESLRERLNHGPLDPGTACHLIARMLEALGCAHANGVVHRDFKPSNVFLPNRDLAQAKLLDFGIAREDGAWSRTLTGQVLGTPLYMAPEQAVGARDIDARADIFAAGCVLVECITGRPLFAGAGSAGLAKLALADDVVPASGIEALPAPLVEVVRAMLARDPAARPGDALALAQAIRAAAHAAAPAVAQPARAATLGSQEARPVVVLMVGPAQAGASADPPADARRLAEVVARFGGDSQALVSGATLVTFGVAGARELAVRAARASLQLRSVVPGRSLALALGRATLQGKVLVGAAIDETTRLVGLSPSAAAAAAEIGTAVFLDGDTAQLLGDQFVVHPHVTAAGSVFELSAERSTTTASRPVLGKDVPFVGRDRELRSLVDLALDSFDESNAALALVLAPAGGGKSRLRREFVTRVQDEADEADEADVLLLIGAADAFRAGTPYEALGAVLRQSAGVQPSDAPLAQTRQLEAFLLRAAPGLAAADGNRVAAFLGEMAGLEPQPHALPLLLGARQDPRTMSDQIRVAWLDWLGAAASESNVLLVLEDLHWGDAPSLALIDAALKAHRDLPLVVTAFARPEVNDRFPHLWRDNGLRIHLPPLRAKAAKELVRSVLPQLSPERIDMLVERADGNPFFLEELLRVTAGSREGAEHLTPPTVLAAIQTRLDQLGDAGKRVLRAASVFGESFWAAGVAALLPQDAGVDIGAWLDVFVAAELVLPPEARNMTGFDVSSDERWRFRHALVRDAAYDTLTDSDRRLGHMLAADHLAATGERDGVVLAVHLERAGETERAMVQWRVAAQQAMDACDGVAVIERCARAEALGPTAHELGRLHALRARAYLDAADFAAAEAAASRALPYLSGPDRWRALASLCLALGRLQRHDDLKARHAELAADEPPDDGEAAYVYALLQATAPLLYAGEAATVEAMLERTREVASLGDLRLAGMWSCLQGEIYIQRGRHFDSMRMVERGISCFEAVGDLRELCNLRNNRFINLIDLGRLDEAESEGTSLFTLVQRIEHNARTIVEANLAHLALARRQPEDAERRARGLLAAHGELEPRVTGFVELVTAQSFLERQDGRAALEWADKAARTLANAPSLLPAAEAACARASSLLGRREDAKIFAASALATLRKLKGVEHGDLLIFLAAVEALRADGAEADARSVALEALRTVEKRLEVFDEAQDRARVLAAMPELPMLAHHGRILGVKFPEAPHVSASPGIPARKGPRAVGSS